MQHPAPAVGHVCVWRKRKQKLTSSAQAAGELKAPSFTLFVMLLQQVYFPPRRNPPLCRQIQNQFRHQNSVHTRSCFWLKQIFTLKKSCSSTQFLVNGELVMNLNATISFYQKCRFSWFCDKEPQRRDFQTEAVSKDPLWEPQQQHHVQLYPRRHDSAAGFLVKVSSTLH